jgi:hypothetical protein
MSDMSDKEVEVIKKELRELKRDVKNVCDALYLSAQTLYACYAVHELRLLRDNLEDLMIRADQTAQRELKDFLEAHPEANAA